MRKSVMKIFIVVCFAWCINIRIIWQLVVSQSHFLCQLCVVHHSNSTTAQQPPGHSSALHTGCSLQLLDYLYYITVILDPIDLWALFFKHYYS